MSRLAQSSTLVRRAAMLIGGGVQPSQVWKLLESDRDVGELSQRISVRIRGGSTNVEALAAERLTLVAGIWHVAETAGTPMAEALERLADHLEALSESGRRRRVAFAGPRATMRLVLVLPFIGCAFSLLLGFNTLEVLFTTPVGWAVTAVGILLLALGRVWSRRLLNRASALTTMPGYLSELLAVALTGGSSVNQAKLNVSNALDRFPIAGISPLSVSAPHTAASQAIALAERAGVSVAEILRAQAHAERREYAAELDERAARLGVQLMVPLGVCVLPAFIVLTVIPMMLAIFRQSSFS